MKDSVLIITNADDGTIEPVVKHLEEMGEKFYRFNTENFPAEMTINLALSDGNLVGSLKNKNGDLLIDWTKVKSVWYRRPASSRIIKEMAEGYVKFIKDEASAALWSLYTNLDAFWMNPPLISQRLLEHNKLYQLKDALRVGLFVPDTVITNDPDKLFSFCQKHGGVIALKILKGKFFTKEESNVPLFIFTQKLSAEKLRERFEGIKLAPLLAQEYIEKKLELRVTIVGQKIFTCAIYSQDSEQTKIDWRRYDFGNIKHLAYQLPKQIEQKLLQLIKIWNLSFGAIDMILTPDDKYVFLEINPNGQWLWIEQLTRMPISRAIAELLANPSNK